MENGKTALRHNAHLLGSQGRTGWVPKAPAVPLRAGSAAMGNGRAPDTGPGHLPCDGRIRCADIEIVSRSVVQRQFGRVALLYAVSSMLEVQSEGRLQQRPTKCVLGRTVRNLNVPLSESLSFD